jgi:hypothetical protein
MRWIVPQSLAPSGGAVLCQPVVRSIDMTGTLESDRVRYLLSDKWPSGHVLKPADGWDFYASAFSPDGKAFVAETFAWATRSVCLPERLALFSTLDGCLLQSSAVETNGFSVAIAFNPSGEYLTCVFETRISVYAVPSLTPCLRLDLFRDRSQGYIEAAALSADGRYAAIIKPVWPNQRTTAGNPLSLPSDGDVATLAEPRGDSKPRQVAIVELRSQAVCWQVACGPDAAYPVLSSDGRILAYTVSDRQHKVVEIWDTMRGHRVARMESIPDLINFMFIPNSDILVFANPRMGLVRLDSLARKPLGALGHPGIEQFRFSPTGTSVVVGAGKNTIETWDLDRSRLGRKGPRNPGTRAGAAASEAELARRFETLAGADATAARKAMVAIEDAGDRGVDFLDSRLQAETVDDAAIGALLRDLDASDFGTRERASSRVESLSPVAKTRLKAIMATADSTEVQIRLKRALAHADDYAIRAPERLRAVRAVECLEMVGSPRSRQVLVRLAAGCPDSPLTKDAAAAIVRMDEWLLGE